MNERARENDPQTLVELRASEKRESQKKGSAQQLGIVRKLAKINLINDKNVTILQKKLDNLLNDINVKLVQRSRPSKEQYYLNISKSIGSRGTCLSVQFGAVIVKDDQIIATGYVGSPRKTQSCIERGFCLRRKLGVPSGHRYEICRSAHAEMNAIINAARAGVSLLGGDIYLYGERIHEGQRTPIDMHPCFICKKLIINAGLNRVICSRADGSFITHTVEGWIKDWQKQDMLDDRFQYNANYGVKDVLLPEVKKDNKTIFKKTNNVLNKNSKTIKKKK
ncbi:hypothetical protein HOK51_05185 [Candidatus Woesearchaeota archaeon]|nr:hypothetical protein [Candidatus Woesearchaeota archaeon]MBT6519221.1 hypothetical protein [Candidatus Woesearchaeota archaeon]MBT7367508.1 hypothetical protein [Candidatus Woesearchaeota archaeon]